MCTAPDVSAPVLSTVFSWEQSLAPNALVDPYRLSDKVLESYPPVFFAAASNPAMGPGMWIATRFEPIREIFQNTDRYSSHGVYPYFEALGINLTAIPISLDPPEHTRFRKFLEPWFAPRAVMAMEPAIRRRIADLIDGFADNGGCDVAYDFGRIYPVRVFMDLMGFPQDMFEQFLGWSYPMHFEVTNLERMGWGVNSALDYMRGFIGEVRAAPPDGTVASRIVHGEIDGRRLTDDEVLGTIFFLWDGGMDTVASTSSLMFRRLAVDPSFSSSCAIIPTNTHKLSRNSYA